MAERSVDTALAADKAGSRSRPQTTEPSQSGVDGPRLRPSATALHRPFVHVLPKGIRSAVVVHSMPARPLLQLPLPDSLAGHLLTYLASEPERTAFR